MQITQPVPAGTAIQLARLAHFADLDMPGGRRAQVHRLLDPRRGRRPGPAVGGAARRRHPAVAPDQRRLGRPRPRRAAGRSTTSPGIERTRRLRRSWSTSVYARTRYSELERRDRAPGEPLETFYDAMHDPWLRPHRRVHPVSPRAMAATKPAGKPPHPPLIAGLLPRPGDRREVPLRDHDPLPGRAEGGARVLGREPRRRVRHGERPGADQGDPQAGHPQGVRSTGCAARTPARRTSAPTSAPPSTRSSRPTSSARRSRRPGRRRGDGRLPRPLRAVRRRLGGDVRGVGDGRRQPRGEVRRARWTTSSAPSGSSPSWSPAGCCRPTPTRGAFMGDTKTGGEMCTGDGLCVQAPAPTSSRSAPAGLHSIKGVYAGGRAADVRLPGGVGGWLRDGTKVPMPPRTRSASCCTCGRRATSLTPAAATSRCSDYFRTPAWSPSGRPRRPRPCLSRALAVPTHASIEGAA
jgi:hypothetical protein